MKHLKIENNQGWFSINGKDWETVSEIKKEDLLIILDYALETEFEMDEYDNSKIANRAHQIIYRNLYEKLDDLSKSKNRFSDDITNSYREAIEKYKQD